MKTYTPRSFKPFLNTPNAWLAAETPIASLLTSLLDVATRNIANAGNVPSTRSGYSHWIGGTAKAASGVQQSKRKGRRLEAQDEGGAGHPGGYGDDGGAMGTMRVFKGIVTGGYGIAAQN